MLTLLAAAIFASVALLIGVVLYPALKRRDVVRNRVESLLQQEREPVDILPNRTRWQIFLADVGAKLRTTPKDFRVYRELITSAGFRKESVYIFLGSKLLLAAALPSFYVALYLMPQAKAPDRVAMLVAISLAIAGYLFPTLVVSRLAENRKVEIFHSLPDLLDLLTVCVEAGLSLDAALVKATENYQEKNNPLIKEINTANLEIRAGKVRAEALKGVAERTMVEDVKSFTAMLVQTEKFGTSLGKTLRTYSDSLRTKRKQFAEERAAKTAVKMLIPLTFCVFPALLVVLLAPAFFRIYTTLVKH